MEQKQIGYLVVAAIVALYLTYSFGAMNGERSRKPSPFAPGPRPTSSASLLIQVSGSVAHPGSYELPANSKVQDALQKAGGATAEADMNALNLTDALRDGDKVIVPPKTAMASTIATSPAAIQTVPNQFVPNQTTPTQPIGGVATPIPFSISTRPTGVPTQSVPFPTQGDPAGIDSSAAAGEPAIISHPNNAMEDFLRKNPVDLNTANAAQLEMLPEIGPKMAQRILDFRALNGPFRSIDDLRRIKGFGEKTMATITPFICVK